MSRESAWRIQLLIQVATNTTKVLPYATVFGAIASVLLASEVMYTA